MLLLAALVLGTTACPGDDSPQTTEQGSSTGDDSTTMTPTTVTVTVTDSATDSGTDTDATTSPTTGVDSTGSTGGPTCGDGIIDGDEQCDGTELGGEDCASQGFDGGELACAADCTFDTSACTTTPVCGNDMIDGDDVCDGTDLGGESCATQGFDRGTLACLRDCTGYDTSGCTQASCADEDIAGNVGPMVASGSTAAGDNDLEPSCGGTSGNDHVVLFTAPADGTYIFDTFGSDYDTKLALFADCDPTSEIACNDDSADTLQSELGIDMVTGDVVYAVIDGFDGGVGSFVLNITQVICGDGMVAGNETCDGGVGAETCDSAGLGGAGPVVCDASCQLDAAACNPPAGYANCTDFPETEVCTGEEICASDGVSSACLEPNCVSVADCAAAPATGTAPVLCQDANGDGTGDCYLDCSMGQTCPTGMSCELGFICLWPA